MRPASTYSRTRAGVCTALGQGCRPIGVCVFEAAAESGTAIEIDGDPSRQDLDYTLAAEALAKGCLFALDSDAHGPGDWPAAEIALAHARLAGIPAERIINTWPVERLLDWAKQRSSAAA